MDDEAIFQTFRADDEVEIIDVDHSRSMITFRSRRTGMREILPYPGLVVARSTLQQGRSIAVRYGVVTADEAKYSRERRVTRGMRRISAMAHLMPTITPLALTVMRWSLGDAACAAHLDRYAATASTDQETAVYAHDGGRRQVKLDLGGGCIRAETDLGGAVTCVQGVDLTISLPEMVAVAAVGRDIREIVDHPALAGTIAHATLRPGGGTMLRFSPGTIAIRDAIDSIPRLALAA